MLSTSSSRRPQGFDKLAAKQIILDLDATDPLPAIRKAVLHGYTTLCYARMVPAGISWRRGSASNIDSAGAVEEVAALSQSGRVARPHRCAPIRFARER